MSQPLKVEAPAVVGAPFGGGYYAGLIRIGDAVHAVIVAPKASGETISAWDDADEPDEIPGAGSYFDGAANTAAMAEAGLRLGKWAQALDISGHTDWHIPSRDELEICYRAFKPTARNNYRFSGDNPSAVPVTWPYALQTPAQTRAGDFQEGGAEAFEARWYWTSTQSSDSYAWGQYFGSGDQDSSSKSYEGRARAVRTIQLTAWSFNPFTPIAMSTRTIDELRAEQARIASEIAEVEQAMKAAPSVYTLGVATIELQAGEIYAGLVLDAATGGPSHHLILLPGEAADVTWQHAKDWAITVRGDLPTRQEQALLFANLKREFEPRWYWSCEQYSDSDAWGQNFDFGSQDLSNKSYEGRARAVRRLPA